MDDFEVTVSTMSFAATTFEESTSKRDNFIWTKLNEITVEDAVLEWLSTLKEKTRKNYQSGMRKLANRGFIDPYINLQSFALVNHEAVIDRVKLVVDWSECTRQARAACYISFTGFLARRLKGIVKKAIPCREGNAKTFYRVYQKVKTEAMNQIQWIAFFKALELINPRDCLIAKIILQGGKRVSEVLKLYTNQIDWDRCEITFKQSKTKSAIRETIITYPQTIMNSLREYIGEREGFLFVTRSGSSIQRNQLAETFAKAGKEAKIPFKVTPHVLRASAVTYLRQQGFPDSEIMGVTGHASSEMIYAYDKRACSENASKYISLII